LEGKRASTSAGGGALISVNARSRRGFRDSHKTYYGIFLDAHGAAGGAERIAIQMNILSETTEFKSKIVINIGEGGHIKKMVGRDRTRSDAVSCYSEF
jgi:hypothetical protein